MPRFFIDFPLQAHSRVLLPRACSHHAARTLRLRSGEHITLFDGQGGQYGARLDYDDAKEVYAELGPRENIEAELPARVVIAQGIAGGDKMDWMIEKAVELGAAAIQPLQTQRSIVRLSGERAQKRVEHWQSLARAACEQCGRNRVPEILSIASLSQFLSQPRDDGALWMLSTTASTSLWEQVRGFPAQSATLLIGPEGGLDAQEESMAIAAGFTAIGLGPRILRTETAALASLAMLNALWSSESLRYQT